MQVTYQGIASFKNPVYLVSYEYGYFSVKRAFSEYHIFSSLIPVCWN